MPNYIRVKQLDSQELSGFFTSISVEDIFNKASSGQFVNTTGNQTISGIKTFTTGIFAPNLVYNTGNQTISGIKTFNTRIFAPNLVYNTGNQIISGVRTFLEGDPNSDSNTIISAGGIGFYSGPDIGVSIGYGGIDSSEGLSLVADSDITLKSRYESPITFGTNNIDRAIITSDGDFGIGTTYPSEKLEVVGNIKAATGVYAPNLVYNTGNQTISGVKTFTTGIFAPNLVYNTGNQTISGVKTFTTGIFAPNLVYNTGNQTISGVKTFATGIFAPNLVYNTGNQTISGVKTFATGIFDTVSGNLILFNSETAPSSPAAGQLFFDTINYNFSGYNGSSWVKLNN
jgi:hypothetical protein